MATTKILTRLFKQKCKTLWYRFRHNIHVGGLDGSVMPHLGEDKIVSVIQKGKYLDIIKYNQTIRLVPCQYNHGIMVEYLENGVLCWRVPYSFDDLKLLEFKYKENREY